MGSSASKAIVSDPLQYAVSNGRPREYDYIVVGGGTAGCVIASRLSENPNATVLVIEAGQTHEGNLLTQIPLAFSKLFRTPADWDFTTTAQEKLDDREVYCARGKVLGGSSSINALIYHRCAPEDLDEWVKLGAKGWGYNDLHPYFHKAEKYTPSSSFPDVRPEDRGRDGHVMTGHPITLPISKLIIDTCQAMGIPYNPDLNTANGTLGVTNFVATIDSKGQRSSAATAYLTKEVLTRPNLTIAVGAMTERVLFSLDNDDNPRATGVELSTSQFSPQYRVTARREVILCAGAFGTPQLLLLSGIGDTSELKPLDIPVVRHLPAVGRNLYDHISCGPITLRAKPEYTLGYLDKPLSGLFALAQWVITGKGPMAGLGSPGGAFIRSNDTSLPLLPKSGKISSVTDFTSGPGAPDIEILWFPVIALDNGFVHPPPGLSGLTMSAIALRPESAGRVSLRTASAWDKPVIDANYFGSESDLNVVLRGVRFILNLARTEPLRSALDLKTGGFDQDSFFWPGDADPDTITDDELTEWLKKNAGPAWHPVSTARIGEKEDSSVVNPDLLVHGVQCLRIVDASVFPSQVSGHPCAIVIAVAEKAADLIKGSQSS